MLRFMVHDMSLFSKVMYKQLCKTFGVKPLEYMDGTRKCKHLFPLWSSKRVIDRIDWHAKIITILQVKQ